MLRVRPGAPPAVALGCAAALLASACSRGEAPGPGSRSPTSASGPAGATPVTVFAASSLREAFIDLAGELARTRPDVRITFDFAGSQELRTRIEHGAPADVFASADARHMQALRAAGLVEAPAVFAHNQPVLAVARDATTSITSLGDLPRARRLVIGAPEVPIGRYTLQILDRAAATLGADFRERVLLRVVSRELNVRQVLAKVGLGEADAAIVYRTDALAAGSKIAIVEIPPAINVVAEYPIAVVARSPHAAGARAFVELVSSPRGRAALRARGFLAGEAAGAAPAPGPP